MRASALALLGALYTGPSALAAQPLLGEGAWSWFGDPRAVTHTGTHSRTYVGWVDQEGDVKVSSYDHTTGDRVTAVLAVRLDQDDHANPSIQVRPDGRLVVYYSPHVGRAMHYRVSSQPEDVRSWQPPQAVPTNSPGIYGYTYPNPIRLADEGTTYLFWRGGNYNPTYSVQNDGSSGWSAARTWISVPGERPYVKYDESGGDTIHAAFTNAHPQEFPNVNVYYARIRAGTVERANGTQIGTLAAPVTPAAADLVYDGAEPAWVHDVADDSSGRPVIVLASFPSAGDHRYRYARWTGTSWQVNEIVAAGGSFRGDGGSLYYSGGLTLDHEDPSRVYLSRRVGSTWEVETWTTPDGGASWSSQAVTSGSTEKNVRPVSPRGFAPFGGDLSVIWMRGAYDSYTSYATSIAATLGSGGNSPPVADAELSVPSGPAPLPVRFDGTPSSDPDGPVSAWSWDFGDGAGASVPEPTHTYIAGGRYFPTLTVTDPSGARSTLVQEVVVGGPTAPLVHTGAAGASTVHGAIDSENQSTSWAVEYGRTREYGSVTPASTLPANDSLHQVSAVLPGLEAGLSYHYRFVATNASGSTSGEDRLMVAGSAPVSDPYRDAVLATPGLSSYWRLGEPSGTTARGETSAATGSYLGRFFLGHLGVLGALGNPAAGFDGTGGELSIPGPALAANATLEGWFRWEAGTATLRDNTGSGGWLLAFDRDGELAYRLGGGGLGTGRPASLVRDGQWHHLVATKNGATGALYVDGALLHSGGGAGSVPAVAPWHVMRNGTTSVFSEGEADELAIYGRALSAGEVRGHYNLGRALAGAPLPPDPPPPAVELPAARGSTAGAGRAGVAGGRLVVRGAPGVNSRLLVRRRGRSWHISDAAARLTAGRGCRRLAARKVSCRAEGVRRVLVYGGAGNDRLAIRGGVRALLDGGAGNDLLRGGSGRDVLRGGPGRDRVSCGRGRDVVIADRRDRGRRAGCEIKRPAR